MRIRIDMRLQLCGNDRLACIELQLLTDRPTGAACVHTGCCNIVSDTGSLRGKVGVLKTRSNATPESRTKVAPASNRLTI